MDSHTFASCAPSLFGLLENSSPPSAAPSENSTIATLCCPPFYPVFPDLQFDFPHAPLHLRLSPVPPLLYVGGGRWCTVPGIGSLRNFCLTSGPRSMMYCRLTCTKISAGSGLRTLRFIYMIGFHLRSAPLSSFLLPPILLDLLAHRFSRAIFATLLTCYKTGDF